MSYHLRGQRVAYSNIAIGSATGKERTILGNAGSTERQGSNVITADGATSPPASSTEPASTTSVAARERIITVSGGVTTLCPRECPVNTNT